MVRYILISLILTVVVSNVRSQDLIVTQFGDSINCTITRQDNKFIYFTYNYNQRKSLLNKKEIVSVQPGFYVGRKNPERKSYNLTQKQLANDSIRKINKSAVPREKIPNSRFRIGISGGYSYRLIMIEDDPDYPEITDLNKKMLSGFGYGAEGVFYFNRFIGVGLVYSRFQSSGVLDPFIYEGYTVRYEETWKINYAGPTFSARFYSRSRKNALMLTAGIGYIDLIDEVKMNNVTVTMTGSSIGSSVGLCLEIGVVKNLSLNVGLKSYVGELSSVTITSDNDTETVDLGSDPLDISHIDATLGICLRF
jgi:hypothetical protein